MNWDGREGRAVIVLLGALIELVLLLVLSAAVAVYFDERYSSTVLHVIIGALAPFFGFFRQEHTLAYVLLLLGYQWLDGGASKVNIAEYATGFAVSSLVINLALYFWPRQQKPGLYYSEN